MYRRAVPPPFRVVAADHVAPPSVESWMRMFSFPAAVLRAYA
jgi:hypothetical protein